MGIQQGLSWKQQWIMHQGESSDRNHFLCSVHRSNALQLKNNLDVYLAGNCKEDGHDFRVNGSFTSLSCKVRRGNSIIAEVQLSLFLVQFVYFQMCLINFLNQCNSYVFLL